MYKKWCTGNTHMDTNFFMKYSNNLSSIFVYLEAGTFVCETEMGTTYSAGSVRCV